MVATCQILPRSSKDNMLLVIQWAATTRQFSEYERVKKKYPSHKMPISLRLSRGALFKVCWQPIRESMGNFLHSPL